MTTARERPAPGAPPLELGPGPAWVFTDLHLDPAAPEEVRAFAASLAAAPPGLPLLLVLGDLFDAWTGPEVWEEPGLAPLASALAELSARGTRVVLLRGNRDVLLEPGDGARVGAEVADAVVLETPGGRILASHGDEYCLQDRPYQRLRRWLRRPAVRRLARSLPWSWRRRAARRLRGISRGAVARKPLDALALVDGAVLQALEIHDAALALVGHLHRREERELAPGRRLRVLPAWSPGTPALVLGGPGGPSLTPGARSVESAGLDPGADLPARAPVITLDGLAGSGKSTLARRLAERLGWAWLDSGAWYRAMTWACREHGVDPGDPGAILDLLSRIDIHAHPDGTVVVDGRPLRQELRTPEIDALVGEVADHPPVREALMAHMRRLRTRPGIAGIVADGRDAGTVIFPDADLKVFVQAEMATRTRRRWEQLQSRPGGPPPGVDPVAVEAALRERDSRDAARGASAPRPAPDGRILVNDTLTVEEAIGRLLAWAAELGGRRGASGPAVPPIPSLED